MSEGYDPGELRARLHEAVYGLLVDKVRQDRYPSATMMDMIEEGMDDAVRVQYAQALLDKVADDRFPSVDMLNRLRGLV